MKIAREEMKEMEEIILIPAKAGLLKSLEWPPIHQSFKLTELFEA